MATECAKHKKVSAAKSLLESSSILESKLNFERPTLSFYRQRPNKGEREAFLVVKARDLTLTETEKDGPKFKGQITDFFPLMGDIDYLSSPEGQNDEFVVCWFADKQEDFKQDFRRLTGVKMSERPQLVSQEHRKETYKVSFTAQGAKLE